MNDRQKRGPSRLRAMRADGRTDRYAFFLLLLILDVMLLLVVPAGRYGLIVVAPFVMGTLVLGLYTSDARPRTMRAGVFGGVVVIIAAIAAVITGQDQFGGLVWLMLAAMLVATPWSILRHIFGGRTVTSRTILGAVSVYILIGLTFAFIELGVQGFLGTFFAQPGLYGPADFVYFSYIAMATVGFGDLTPAAGVPRAIVVPAVLIGQVYLVTTVARLVSMYGQPQVEPIVGPIVRPTETEASDQRAPE